MNRLSLARRTQIIGALVDGNSIRSTERMTNTHRDTILRLMVEVGTGCAKLHNEQMQNLSCKRIQCDENLVLREGEAGSHRQGSAAHAHW